MAHQMLTKIIQNRQAEFSWLDKQVIRVRTETDKPDRQTRSKPRKSTTTIKAWHLSTKENGDYYFTKFRMYESPFELCEKVSELIGCTCIQSKYFQPRKFYTGVVWCVLGGVVWGNVRRCHGPSLLR